MSKFRAMSKQNEKAEVSMLDSNGDDDMKTGEKVC